MNEKIRNDRIALAKNRCEWCGKKGTELHHVFSRKSEHIETVRFLCAFCHRGGGYQARLNIMKVEASAELIEKYGEDRARLMSGGRLYFGLTKTNAIEAKKILAEYDSNKLAEKTGSDKVTTTKE